MLPQITLFSLLLQLFLCFAFNFSFHLCQHVVPACNEFLLWVFPKAITADTLTSCPLIRGSKRYIREWWGLCIKTKPDNRRFLTLSLIEHYRWSGKATMCMRRRCIVRKPDNQWCSHIIWHRFCLNQMLESKGCSPNKRDNLGFLNNFLSQYQYK